MAEFMSASMRAAGSDLTIAISPLGLIELSDEEFEVHGPRLTRYAQNWAFYLGHHWAYRRQVGEPQLVFNYAAALSDYLTNFTFGKPVQFHSDKRVAHIVPALIDRILSKDNNKEQLFWCMGNLGSVSGDAFCKIAYDPPWQDPAGNPHPGRVRLLAINPAFAFPEWAPHDQERLIRFKLKYRFWATSPEGTRQVYTYTEIITDDVIEEYVNDQLISQRDNPLGEIPVVHIANKPAASSPWGLSDIQNIISLNREYNEKASEVSDIINYHTAPVTVITGAKSSSLERGANKIWGILQPDAKVYNLEGGDEGLPLALEYLEVIKRSMHEMTGVPETALGQAQPISNTSGVALAIQFMPLMMGWTLKTNQYGAGWKQIMYFALRTLFLEEPETMLFDPNTDGLVEDEEMQLPQVNPQDPVTYDLDIVWPPPLPVDIVIKLNEIMMKMQLGLESKRGALLDLGEQFPDEKRQELFEEMMIEAKMDGAGQILKAHIAAAVMELTGMVPGPDGSMTPQEQPDPGTTSTTKTAKGTTTTKKTLPLPKPPALGGLGDLQNIIGKQGNDTLTAMVTQAYGTKIPQARNVDKNDNSRNTP
jgi:hypothetical protein